MMRQEFGAFVDVYYSILVGSTLKKYDTEKTRGNEWMLFHYINFGYV